MQDEREKWEIIWLKLEHQAADLEHRIQVLQARLEIVNALRSNVSELRSTLSNAPDDMLSLLEPEADKKLLEAIRQKIAEQQGTHFQKIERYFQSVGNRPSTIADLETVTRIPRASLSAVLYRTHPEKFASGESQNSRAKLWWLESAPPGLVAPPPRPESTFDEPPPEVEPPRGEEDIPF